MKNYTHYRRHLMIWLVSLNMLSACVNTRQKLGISGDIYIESIQSLTLIADHPTENGPPLVTNPMSLDKKVMSYLIKNNFSKESIKNLLDQGLDIKATDKDQWTLLMCTIVYLEKEDNIAKYKKTESCNFIVDRIKNDKNGSVDAQTKDGLTALMLATWLKIKPIFNILITANADPFIKIKCSREHEENNSIEQIKCLWPIELKKDMTAMDAAKVDIEYPEKIYDFNKEKKTIENYMIKMLIDYQTYYRIKTPQILVQRSSST